MSHSHRQRNKTTVEFRRAVAGDENQAVVPCMEVGLVPGDFALDGDPAPLSKMGRIPNFRPMSIVAKRLHV